MVNSMTVSCQGAVTAKRPKSSPCFTVGMRCFFADALLGFLQMWRRNDSQTSLLWSRLSKGDSAFQALAVLPCCF